MGTSTAALSWLEEVDDDDGVCGVCSAMAGASDIPTPTSTSLLVHIYIGIHSTFFGRISMRTDLRKGVQQRGSTWAVFWRKSAYFSSPGFGDKKYAHFGAKQ